MVCLGAVLAQILARWKMETVMETLSVLDPLFVELTTAKKLFYLANQLLEDILHQPMIAVYHLRNIFPATV